MDVITAFLNGDINEDIFMEIPDGFPGASNPTLVCKINRALYGLKQAPKAWYDRINSWLHNLGLTRSTSDPNLYYRRCQGKLTILLYIDDLLIISNDEPAITDLKAKLHQTFEMTDLGAAHTYLGVKIHRQPSGIFLSQYSYITNLFTKFHLFGCNSTRLPIDPKTQLHRCMGTPKIDLAQYRSLVGSLIYLSHTRPDISYAVSQVACYMQDPEVAHL